MLKLDFYRFGGGAFDNNYDNSDNVTAFHLNKINCSNDDFCTINQFSLLKGMVNEKNIGTIFFALGSPRYPDYEDFKKCSIFSELNLNNDYTGWLNKAKVNLLKVIHLWFILEKRINLLTFPIKYISQLYITPDQTMDFFRKNFDSEIAYEKINNLFGNCYSGIETISSLNCHPNDFNDDCNKLDYNPYWNNEPNIEIPAFVYNALEELFYDGFKPMTEDENPAVICLPAPKKDVSKEVKEEVKETKEKTKESNKETKKEVVKTNETHDEPESVVYSKKVDWILKKHPEYQKSIETRLERLYDDRMKTKPSQTLEVVNAMKKVFDIQKEIESYKPDEVDKIKDAESRKLEAQKVSDETLDLAYELKYGLEKTLKVLYITDGDNFIIGSDFKNDWYIVLLSDGMRFCNTFEKAKENLKVYGPKPVKSDDKPEDVNKTESKPAEEEKKTETAA